MNGCEELRYGRGWHPKAKTRNTTVYWRNKIIIKQVYQVQAESYNEEQAILAKVPEAVWVNLEGVTMFFIPESDIKIIREMEKS